MAVARSTDLPELVADAVEEVLKIAQSWLRWDGTSRVGVDPTRIYTPHKCIRRTADHLVDHLAQVEALLASADSVADQWHGSLVTTDADWARFTEVDLDEAGQRLRRLAQIYRLRLLHIGPEERDAARPGGWPVRDIVVHVADPWYAQQVGRLGPPERP